MSAGEASCGSIGDMPDWFALTEDSRRFAHDRAAFGAWIIETRRRLACSQAALGAMVGLHQSTISRLERGLVAYLRFRTALRLMVVILATCGTDPARPSVAPAFLRRA